jgi:type III secretion protein V
MVVPWSIDVSLDLLPLLEDELYKDEVVRRGLFTAGAGLRERVFSELGVVLPAPRVETVEGLPARHVVVSLFEVPALVAKIEPEMSDADAVSHVTNTALPLLRMRAADFIGMTETQHLLDQLDQIAPSLVRQVVPKPVSLALLTDVLRRLVEEQVSIRDLRAILEALGTAAQSEKDPLTLAEFVRGQLRRATTYRLTAGKSEISVYLLDPSIEEAVRHAVTRTPQGSFLTLAPAAARDVVTAIRRALSTSPARPAQSSARAAVILTQPDIRRFVRKLIETDLPHVTVVSYAELLPEIAIRPIAKATLVGIG